jgi:ADP-ribosylglycohydrolase
MKNAIIGTIIGDIVGSRFEKQGIKSKDFVLFEKNSVFTDDTVLTMAILKSIKNKEDYLKNVVDFSKRYPDRGYGGRYLRWLEGDTRKGYNSYGNGSAMRVSPIGTYFKGEELLKEAAKSSEITHNHPEGIKGAQCIAMAIEMVKEGSSKKNLKAILSKKYNYDLDRTLDEIRPSYEFSAICQRTVPESIICFLESTSFEDCLRNAISLGGDTDTMAAMSGGIAALYYGIPDEFIVEMKKKLPTEFLLLLEGEFND